MTNETFEEKIVHRGEIYYMHYGATIGSEQTKARPVVIVSNNVCNMHSPTVTVLPITSRDKKPLPTHVQIPDDMPVYGIILAEQIITVAKERLDSYLGEFDQKTMQAITDAIAVQCAITSTADATDDDAEIEKLHNEVAALRAQLNTTKIEAVCTDVSVDDLKQRLAKVQQRAEIFEQLYKEEVLKSCKH